MKKIITTVCLLLIGVLAMAQAPEFFNYQAVIRDASGELITNQSINARFSIIDDASGFEVLYTETHAVTTSDHGAISIKIGTGLPVQGIFSNINWSINEKFLNVGIDIGDGYIDMGTFQMISVPYSFFSNLSDSSNISNMAYSANVAEYSDSAGVAAMAYSSNTSAFANEAQTAYVLGSNAVYSPSSDTLFVVKDYDGNVVFAVFPDGAQVIVNETAKGKVGGFAVSGRSPSKAVDHNILNVTMDSTRIYVNDTITAKGKVGGFAVSGRSPSKGVGTEILYVTSDSTRIYVNEESVKGKVGGFAVSGRSPSKGTTYDYLQVNRDSTRVYIADTPIAKGKVGGFAVSGRSPSKGTSQHMFYTTADSTRIFTQDTIGGFGVYDNRGSGSSSYMHLTPLNYFIGHNSGQKIEYDTLNPGMGKYNTFFGYETGANSVSGFKNIYMGYKSGYNDVGGGWNIFIGNNAGFSSTGSLSNICIGDEAGYSFTNGINNIFIGKESGYNSTENVYQNVFIGNSAGKSNVSGGYNVYLGISAGYNALGSNNVFLGNASGFGNTGSLNTLLGSESGIYSAGGTRNVYIGYKAGYRSYGTRNVFIGTNANNTNFSSVDYSNSIAIGDSVIVTASNQIRIGNSNATSLYLEGAHNVTSSGGTALYINSSGKLGTVVSSKRYKKDIADLEINTSNIYKLKPVSFTLKSDNQRYFGLIAEDVAELIPGLVEFVKASDVIQGSESEEMIPNSVHYPILSVLLLNEIQKHEETIKTQADQIKSLENKNKELEERLNKIEKLISK